MKTEERGWKEKRYKNMEEIGLKEKRKGKKKKKKDENKGHKRN